MKKEYVITALDREKDKIFTECFMAESKEDARCKYREKYGFIATNVLSIVETGRKTEEPQKKKSIKELTTDSLYDILDSDYRSKSPFYSRKIDDLYNELLDEYIEPYVPERIYDKANTCAAGLYAESQRNGFRVGFNSAINLILDRK